MNKYLIIENLGSRNIATKKTTSKEMNKNENEG